MGYLVKEEDADFDGLQAKVAKQQEFLSKAERVDLYKEELLAKEALVKTLQTVVSAECEDFESLKSDLLHRSNQLHKDMNRRKYKKDKHSRSKFKDWE